jgi:hypothetical protein
MQLSESKNKKNRNNLVFKQQLKGLILNKGREKSLDGLVAQLVRASCLYILEYTYATRKSRVRPPPGPLLIFRLMLFTQNINNLYF